MEGIPRTSPSEDQKPERKPERKKGYKLKNYPNRCV